MYKYLGLFGAFAFALAIGVSAPAGAKVGAKCGGLGGGFCGQNEFCQRPIGVCFNFDIQGTCVAKPDVCHVRRGVFYIKECGCDGVTYANDCERRKAGVTIKKKGAC